VNEWNTNKLKLSDKYNEKYAWESMFDLDLNIEEKTEQNEILKSWDWSDCRDFADDVKLADANTLRKGMKN